MSRHDDDEFDDEDDPPRRKARHDDEDADESEEHSGDEEPEARSALGGWRPVGEAIFWGVVFLGLTLVAFSLGEGIGVKRPIAGKDPEPDKPVTFDENEETSKKPDDSMFAAKIDSPAPKPPDDEKKLDFSAPPSKAETRTPITPAKAEMPLPDEPTTKLPWQSMLAQTELKLTSKPKPVAVKPPPVIDDGPTSRLDVERLTKVVTLVPKTTRLDVAAMVKQVELVPKTTRLDWAAMLKTVRVEPKPTRLDHEALTKHVTVAPPPKKPVVESIAATAPVLKETPTPAVVATVLQLRELPALQQVGKAVVLVAKVLGADGRPLADQLVEWNLDRQGVGEILSIPNDSRTARPGERPWPTFARTYTAKSPYRLDASLGGAEIGVGETWIAVESASAGGMYASAQAPAVASSSAGRGGAFFHWDRAKAIFPEAVAAQAGGEAVVATRVLAAEGDAPLPEYRVRYILSDANGAEPASGDGALEVESRGDGRAPAAFRQPVPKPGVTRGKIELLGRHPLSGRPAPVLAAGDFVINWTAPSVAVAAKFPTAWRLGESVAGSVVVQNNGESAVRNLKVRQEIPSGVRLVSAEGAAVDAQAATWDIDRLDPGAERTLPITLQGTADGRRSLRAVALGRLFADGPVTAADVVIEGVPSLAVSIRDSADPAPIGSDVEYTISIRNHGNAPARNVDVEIVATGLELLSVDGSLGGAVRGGRYEPAAIAELPAGGRVVARLRAKAASAGDARLAVRLRHPSLAAGLLDEQETTVVYRP